MIKDYRWRRKRIELVPIFPGYVFARFAYPDQYHQVKWARGVMDVVKFGQGPPSTLDDNAVSFFQNRMDEEGVVDTNPEFKQGDPVKFRTDPFKGLMGTILRTDSAKGRILVLMEFLYEARIEVDSYQIQPI
jgi:transcriptional antiterminator RfaH